MRILQLDLIAYGPFTGQSLVFPDQGANFFIVQGPNEAGKSSALRALRGWLFGFPDRTSDDFLHRQTNLRVGGILQNAKGKTWHFVRRKGRVRTLLTPRGEPWEDTTPQELLGNLSKEAFSRLYAFDYEGLLQGSEELLQDQGQLGRALFAAAGGLSLLRKLRQKLEQHRDSLFRPRARNPRINELCRQIEKRRKEQHRLLLTASAWKELHQHCEEAKRRCQQLEQQRQELLRELDRLKRIHDSFPLVTQLWQVERELERLKDVPLLAEDFGQRRAQALLQRNQLRGQLSACQKQVEELRQELDALPEESPLLREEVLIRELYKEIGQHTKAVSDRRNLQRELEEKQQEKERLLQQLSLPSDHRNAEQLEASLRQRRKVQQLISQYDNLAGEIRQAEQNLQDQQQQLEEVMQQLATWPECTDPAALGQAVEFATQHAHAEKQARDLESELGTLQKDIENLARRLGIPGDKWAEVEALPVPGEEVRESFHKQLETLEADQVHLRRRLEEVQANQRQYREELAQLQAQREIPTEGELQQARALRDQGWQLVCQVVQGTLALDSPGVARYVEHVEGAGGLLDAFRLALERADRLADLLRREAQHVARRAELESALGQLQQQQQHYQRQLQQLHQQQAEVLRQWEQKWRPAGIKPESPPNMASWYRNYEKLLDQRTLFRSKTADRDALLQQQQQARDALFQGLRSAGISPPQEATSLSRLLLFCREELKRMEERNQQREKLETKLETIRNQQQRLQRQLQQFRHQRQQWQAQWTELVQQLGQAPQADPDQVREFLETAEHVLSLWREIGQLESRIRGIDQDLQHYAQQVRQLIQRVAPERVGQVRPDVQQLQAVVSQLHEELERAGRERKRAEDLEKRLRDGEEELQKLQGKLQGWENELRELCRRARCRDPEQLEQIELKSRKRQQREQERETLRTNLQRQAGHQPLDEWIQQIQRHQPEQIEQQLQQCNTQLEEVQQELAEAQREQGRCEAELKRHDGSGRVAGLQQERELLLDKLEETTEQYLNTFLAAWVLRRAIERFQREQQGPVLGRASELFARLTCGSFQELQIGYDNRDQQVLVGVRPDGEQVLVPGMSDGTRDQLYLALRLALLEHALQQREPVPFVVDDILIMFDDQRAAAALNALADLAQKTQVIFFTHHEHLGQIAQEALGPKRFHLVKLDRE